MSSAHRPENVGSDSDVRQHAHEPVWSDDASCSYLLQAILDGLFPYKYQDLRLASSLTATVPRHQSNLLLGLLDATAGIGARSTEWEQFARELRKETHEPPVNRRSWFVAIGELLWELQETLQVALLYGSWSDYESKRRADENMRAIAQRPYVKINGDWVDNDGENWRQEDRPTRRKGFPDDGNNH